MFNGKFGIVFNKIKDIISYLFIILFSQIIIQKEDIDWANERIDEVLTTL